MMAMSIKENTDMIRHTERESTNGIEIHGKEISMWETSSMIKLKVMARTITTIKVSIKDSSRTIIEKDMGYSESMMEIFKKGNIKEARIMVTINKIVRIIYGQVSDIK